LTPLTAVERTTVTCASLLRRSASAAAEVLGDLPRSRVQRVQDGAVRLAARLRRDDVVAQFARFLIVGGITTVVYALLFMTLQDAGDLNYLPAHLTATAVTTAMANEMHRRLTFRAEERVGWLSAQWEAGGVTVIGLVATSSALTWLGSATDTAHQLVQVAVVVTVTAVIGALRFVALRWIFRPHVAARA
jgi:putative flippase GtrA